MKKIKIFIITQKDSLVIPNNLQLLYDANFIEIIGGCVIKSKNSLSEKKVLFIKNFGIFPYLSSESRRGPRDLHSEIPKDGKKTKRSL